MYFFVYILKCADGSCYTGHTDNLEKRIGEHQFMKRWLQSEKLKTGLGKRKKLLLKTIGKIFLDLPRKILENRY